MKLVKLANIAVVITCTLASVLVGLRIWESRNPPAVLSSTEPAVPYQPSDVMDPIPDVDFAASEKTLVLFVSSRCRFCTDSAPFYRQLIGATPRTGGVRFVAAGVEPREVLASYLRELSVEVDAIVSFPGPPPRRVRGTPTLVLVNSEGQVDLSWVGMLRESDQAALRRALQQ